MASAPTLPDEWRLPAAAFAAGACAGAAAVALTHYVPATPHALPSGSSTTSDPVRRAARGARAHAPELLAEQLSRNRLFFGDDGQEALEGAFVVVVGLGGVGSHAAHMLARAGIGRLRLVDFDNVTLSSLNRHAVATRDDVGRAKVLACADHFHDTIPGCAIDARVAMFTADAAETLLDGKLCLSPPSLFLRQCFCLSSVPFGALSVYCCTCTLRREWQWEYRAGL